MVYGVTDKMESAIRNLMEPEYSRNTKQIYYRDSEGDLYKNNFSYVDPYDVVKKPFRTIALAFADGKRTQKDRDKILFDGIMEALTDLSTPFIEEAILSESIVDIYNHYARNGETKDGRQIKGWNNDPDSSEAMGDNIAASLKHAFASFLPGSTPQVARAWQSVVDPKLETGQELEPVVELFANVTGIRWNKITEQYVAKSLERKIGTYSRTITEINKEAIDKMQGGYRNMAGYEQTYNEKDVVNTYLDLSKRHYKATMNLKLAQESAIDLYEDLIEVGTGSTGKLPVNNIFQKQGLDKGKIQQKEYSNLSLNRYSPLEITESTWDKISLKNDFKWMTLNELKAVISSYQRGFAALPLLDLERSAYRDNAKKLLEKRADEIFEERGLIERNQKFEGGAVSKDFPVSNAIQNPSKRIDPNTAMPYDEPLARFGFKGGGLMNGVSDPLSRLGFKGGGLMLSVGVSPVSEEQISKFKKVLKKREAKREGGRIGFQEGTSTMEEIVVTGRMPSLQRRLKERAPRYGQGPAADRYAMFGPNYKPMHPTEFAKWAKENVPITLGQMEEWGKQGYSYDDIMSAMEEIPLGNQKAWEEFVKTSVLDEATGQRYSQEEWKKMQRIGSKERKLAKKIIKATKKGKGAEKRDKEFKGGKTREQYALGDKIRKRIAERRARKKQEKVPIEEIEVTAKKRPVIEDKKEAEEALAKVVESFEWEKDVDNYIQGDADRRLARAIVMAESKGDPSLVSKQGAVGLMQIMPDTASQPGYGVTPFDGDDLHNQKKNIAFGWDYFTAMRKTFGDDQTAHIAYNWGPGNTQVWLDAGGNLENIPDETKDYLEEIKKYNK